MRTRVCKHAHASCLHLREARAWLRAMPEEPIIFGIVVCKRLSAAFWTGSLGTWEPRVTAGARRVAVWGLQVPLALPLPSPLSSLIACSFSRGRFRGQLTHSKTTRGKQHAAVAQQQGQGAQGRATPCFGCAAPVLHPGRVPAAPAGACHPGPDHRCGAGWAGRVLCWGAALGASAHTAQLLMHAPWLAPQHPALMKSDTCGAHHGIYMNHSSHDRCTSQARASR